MTRQRAPERPRRTSSARGRSRSCSACTRTSRWPPSSASASSSPPGSPSRPPWRAPRRRSACSRATRRRPSPRPATLDSIDLPTLWREAAIVGYPILPLVRAIPGACRTAERARALRRDDPGHHGHRTRAAAARGPRPLDALLADLGDALALRAAEHRDTVDGRADARPAGRPDDVRREARHVPRAAHAAPRPAGPSASARLRRLASTARPAPPRRSVPVGRRCARRARRAPGARGRHVPWHVTRDGLAEFGGLCARSPPPVPASPARSSTSADRDRRGRGGRGHHRGASSTMPQKANPILSETHRRHRGHGEALAAPLLRAMEAGHERAAGEWQIEWDVHAPDRRARRQRPGEPHRASPARCTRRTP